MNQLFRALPRDLQWFILSEFVGSHSVRNGKLIRKLIFDERHQILQKIPRVRVIWHPPHMYVMPSAFVQFSNGTQLMYTYYPEMRALGYVFVSNDIRADYHHSGVCTFKQHEWKRQDATSGTEFMGVPPYEKHYYPSYPDTDKKKKARKEQVIKLKISLIH